MRRSALIKCSRLTTVTLLIQAILGGFHPTWFRHNRPSTVNPFMAVHGHFPIQKYDLVSPAVRVVMLREPVENLISIYYYWKSLFDSPAEGHGIYAFVKKQRLSLLEMAQIPVLRRLMSVTFFGDFDMRRFDVIGAHEHRSEFIDEFLRSSVSHCRQRIERT